MKVGDILTVKPAIFMAVGEDDPKSMPGRVVYIHPKNRFYIVEFYVKETGQRWRETFYFPVREGRRYNEEFRTKWIKKGTKK